MTVTSSTITSRTASSADATTSNGADPARRPVGSFDPRRARLVTAGCAVVLLAASAAFLSYDLQGSLSFALELRATKLAGMAVAGTGLGMSAVLFHTVSENRILTPALMGFDALFVLIQTTAAFAVGTMTFVSLDARLRFGIELAVMLGFALGLNEVFLRRARDDLAVLLLVGVVMGGMFRSLSVLAARLIDPNELIVLQDQFFASFANIDEQLLGVSALVLVGACAWAWSLVDELDVAALGPALATNLGVDHQRLTRRVMLLVALLVSVPTALLGPVTFLGLLVANLAYRLTGTFRHRHTLVIAPLAGTAILVIAQFAVEELFDFGARAPVVVSMIGGVLFIVLLLREARR